MPLFFTLPSERKHTMSSSVPPNKQPLDKLNIFSLSSVQMRTFHLTWFAFFVCFMAWFGLAPLMPVIRTELGLSKDQVGNIIIASVTSTIIARLAIGWLCDKYGPRKTYVGLLVLGSLPVMGVGLAHDYTSFLLFRLAIGIIGASFVLTQFHAGIMFTPRLKGTANAIAGGWGNLGGGVTHFTVPIVFSLIVAMGYAPASAWRLTMLVPAAFMLLTAALYWKYTTDTPAGNFDDIGHEPAKQKTDYRVLREWRVWALACAYAMSFGMEITVDNVAALHFTDTFKMDMQTAAFLAGIFGLMNLFARALGGWVADKAGQKAGLVGKGRLLGIMLLLEGLFIWVFAQAGHVTLAVVLMLTFALFLKMSNGATYSITPFINKDNVGLVSGVVGAGGNIGGMAFAFLFKNMPYAQAFNIIGMIVMGIGVVVLLTRFNKEPAAAISSDSVAVTR